MKKSKLRQEISDAGGNILDVFLARGIDGLIRRLSAYKRKKYQRSVAFGDLVTDRNEKAAFLGFGTGTTIYDNVLVLGDVKVGKNTWIGPNVILDGTGGLRVGNGCVISAGVQIYTHDTVDATISSGAKATTYAPTVINDHCYIGPNVIIQKGVTIGDHAVIGANSFVNRDVPARTKAFGCPARPVGLVNTT